jgi:hypothetical protein
VGMHHHRRAGARPLRAVRQDAPFADRRHQRHAHAAGRHVHRPGEEPVPTALLVGRRRHAGPSQAPRRGTDDGQRDGRGGTGAARPAEIGAATAGRLRQDLPARRRGRPRPRWSG